MSASLSAIEGSPRREYSTVWHFASAVLLGAAPRAWLGMFTAYYDDTGGPDLHGVGAFGLLAPVEAWVSFEKDWNAVLALPDFDLCYLHMKEMNTGRGDYERFKDNPDLQAALLGRLHQVMSRYVVHSPGWYLPNDAFRSLNEEYAIADTVEDAFWVTAMHAINSSINWVVRNHLGEPLELVFDRGCKSWGRIVNWCEAKFHKTPTQKRMCQLAPLQAADLVAWENRRFSERVASRVLGGEPPGEPRREYGSLVDALDPVADWQYMHEDALRSFCERHAKKRTSGV